MEKKTHDFWPFGMAKNLIRDWKADKQVVTTGTSISGDPHIGNANDVILGDAIKIALEKSGANVELVWISDNMDPFRSVPSGMPDEMKEYLGVPASMIPDFWKDGHKDFIEHFESKFLAQFEKVGIKLKIMRGNEMYKSGMYNDVIKVSMEKRKEITEILNKYKEKKLGNDWYPINVICKKCRRISTTAIKSYDKEKLEVEYKCSSEEILLNKKNEVRGCGHSGNVSILNGNAKITWRVEWAARWSLLGTTCEPFGKEHASAGGSWDTGKEIAEKIFNYKPPMPVVYEHFLVGGEKMSKSKGNVITVDDMLELMPPEYLRYWMFQGKLTIAKNIVLKDIVPRIFDDFDRAKEVFSNPEIEKDEKDRNNLIRAYELAVSGIETRDEEKMSFEEMKKIIIEDRSEKESEKLKLVKKWVDKFEKRSFLQEKLEGDERKAVEDVISAIGESKDAEGLQSSIFEIAKTNNLKPMKLFKLLYQIMMGTERGPKLGPYIIKHGKEEVIQKLKKLI